MIQSIERAIKILEVLRQQDAMTLTEISQDLGLAKTTVYGILQTLESGRFVRKNKKSAKYYLGDAFLIYGNTYTSRLDVRQIAYPYMTRMRDELGETVQLSVLSGRMVVYVEKVEPDLFFLFQTRIGATMPAHCTATGKVLLSSLPDHDLEMLYKNIVLEKVGKNTISEFSQLMDDIRQIRKRGYSIDNGESQDEIMGFAAGVYNYDNQMVAALSLGGSRERISKKDSNVIINMLMATTKSISQKMGSRTE